MLGDKLKKIFENKNENKKTDKKIENLVFLIILAIITIVIINIIWNDKKILIKQNNNMNNKQLAKSETEGNEFNINNDNYEQNDSNRLEEKLELILSKIQGVEDVNVFINYSESSEVIAMYNENSKISTTEESDDSGGTRKIQETDTQKDIIYKEESGNKVPITKKIVQPKIEGAIITAKGASNANIKANIIQAIEAVTGLATHKIQVFESN